MDPATITGLAAVLVPLLGNLFGGGSKDSGALGLTNDPDVLAQIKRAMFGLGPNGQSDFYGGLLGQQYQQAIDKAPLQAAITRMAGKLLPTAYQPGVVDGLGGVHGDGMPPVIQRNGTTDGPVEQVHLTPPPVPNGSGGGAANGGDPNRFGKLTQAPPSYAQLLQMVG